MGSCYSTRSQQMPHPTQTNISSTTKKPDIPQKDGNSTRSKSSSMRFGDLKRAAFGFRKSGLEKVQQCQEIGVSPSASSVKHESARVSKGCSTNTSASPVPARGRFGFKRHTKEATAKVGDKSTNISRESMISSSSTGKEPQRNKPLKVTKSPNVAAPTATCKADVVDTVESISRGSATKLQSCKAKIEPHHRSLDEGKEDKTNGNIPMADESDHDENDNISAELNFARKRGGQVKPDNRSETLVHSSKRFNYNNGNIVNKPQLQSPQSNKYPRTHAQNIKPALTTKNMNVVENKSKSKLSGNMVSSFGFQSRKTSISKQKSFSTKSSQAKKSNHEVSFSSEVDEVEVSNSKSDLAEKPTPESVIVSYTCDEKADFVNKSPVNANENEFLVEGVETDKTVIKYNYRNPSVENEKDGMSEVAEAPVVGDEKEQPNIARDRLVSDGSLPSLASDDLMLDFDVDFSYNDVILHDSPDINRCRAKGTRPRTSSTRIRTHSYSSDKNRRVNEYACTCSRQQAGGERCGEEGCAQKSNRLSQRANSSDNSTALTELSQLMDTHNQSRSRRLMRGEKPRRPASFPGPQQMVPSKAAFVLKPPRTNSLGDDDEAVQVEAGLYRQITQDCTILKTMLLRLKRSLQEDELSSPLSAKPWKAGMNFGSQPNSPMASISMLESFSAQSENSPMDKAALLMENQALREQLRQQQQQLDDQQRTISLLQMQMMGSTNVGPNSQASGQGKDGHCKTQMIQNSPIKRNNSSAGVPKTVKHTSNKDVKGPEPPFLNNASDGTESYDSVSRRQEILGEANSCDLSAIVHPVTLDESTSPDAPSPQVIPSAASLIGVAVSRSQEKPGIAPPSDTVENACIVTSQRPSSKGDASSARSVTKGVVSSRDMVRPSTRIGSASSGHLPRAASKAKSQGTLATGRFTAAKPQHIAKKPVNSPRSRADPSRIKPATTYSFKTRDDTPVGCDSYIPAARRENRLTNVGELKSKLPLNDKVASVKKPSKLPSKTFGK